MKQCLKNGIAVQGYDVIEFFNDNIIEGSNDHTVEYKGGKYLFASEENKNKFAENPQAFCPQYGGFCAMAMTKGDDLSPNIKNFIIKDGKLYFFTRIFFGMLDAKRQWVKDPEGQKTKADLAWEKSNS